MGELIETKVDNYVQTFFDNKLNIPVLITTLVKLESVNTVVIIKTLFPHWDCVVEKKAQSSNRFKLSVELNSELKKNESVYFSMMERLAKKLPKIYNEKLNCWVVDSSSKKEAEQAHTRAVEVVSNF